MIRAKYQKSQVKDDESIIIINLDPSEATPDQLSLPLTGHVSEDGAQHHFIVNHVAPDGDLELKWKDGSNPDLLCGLLDDDIHIGHEFDRIDGQTQALWSYTVDHINS